MTRFVPVCLRSILRVVILFLLCVSLFVSLTPPLTVRATKDRTLRNKPSPQSVKAPARPGELLVGFRAGVGPQQKDRILNSHGVRVKRRLRGDSGIERLEVLSGQSVNSVALQLMLEPEIEFAEPNYLVRQDQSGSPNDPEFGNQWSLKNIGQAGGQFGADINVEAAWQTTTGSTSVPIAVIDSGIDFTHPDLANNRWQYTDEQPNGDDDNGDGYVDEVNGWDFITGGPAIIDQQGHGTAVAGIIAAQGNNGIGMSGVMWRASLMSLRVLDSTGTGDVGDAIEAIDFAVSHGALVINLSWGTSAESLALKQAIERAAHRGVVVVCSAGNNGQDLELTPYYPASFHTRDLIVVAASDNFDQLTSWSNWGRRTVTLAAPGTNVLTTRLGGGYAMVSGTSASAPLVSGVAGLLKSSKPWLGTQAIAKALSDGARQVMSLSTKVTSGGVVDAGNAFNSLRPNGNGNSPRGGNAHGPGGTSVTPPEVTNSAPSGLPNLDHLRNTRANQPNASAPIKSNLTCADCDPLNGGGGGGNFPSGDPNFSTARNRPANETGEEGEDLGSQNFNWSVPIVGLPGRSGLDLNLTLFYNSLVWTKDGSFIKFNADLGNPAPGFKLGLPTLQQKFTDSVTGLQAYIMIEPSGHRVLMRRVGATNKYESQDSDYTELTEVDANNAVVRTTDGRQFKFIRVTINNEYRCERITDRNGNYISATYNTTNGHLLTITDTLGRVVSFVYDGDNNLQAISQTWNGSAHNWATFVYDQVFVSPAFGGGLLVNGPNGINVTILKRVNLHDGSYFVFDYNAAFGQITQIKQHAPNNELLNYISYNLNTASGQTECPRFTARRDWARYWNGDWDGVPVAQEEAITTFTVDPGGAWTRVKFPNDTVLKAFFATSGWQKGLMTETKHYATSAQADADVWKKRTVTTWTQDDTGLTFQKNPRVSEINVYDAEGNRRRTTIEYVTGFSLPTHVREYTGPNGDNFVRLFITAYKWESQYVDRRIIGLPFEQVTTDGAAGNIVQRLIFHYDWADPWYFSAQMPSTNYDSVNYPSSFVSGRGNLIGIQRYNCQNNTTAYDGNLARWLVLHHHNMAGSVIWVEDGSWHHTSISYGDSFSDGNNGRNTLAYPTSITDHDGFTTTLQYNFDFGAQTRTQTPAPAGQSQGAIQTFTYDAAARLDRVTTTNNNAYARFVYPSNMGYIQRFDTINDATEQQSATYFDGAFRVRATSADLPNSVGGFVGQLVAFDSMGRVSSKSNPIEINSAWGPTGDDAAGWVWTQQTYDWQGRPLVTTNPDGWTRSLSYGGCGCAGGEVITSTDEAGRRKRATMDGLGRLQKLEELNWNGTVYSTTLYTFNARDQITNITQQSDRVRSFAYDGFGRLQTRTTPEQGATNYTYFDDDQVQMITDARGAKSTFGYNGRHLLTGITYDISQAPGVATTPNVTYGYDGAGNRTSMTDGLGSTTYAYDQLSRMTSETRNLTGVGSYTLSYAYNLAGELTSFTNPWNAQVGYSYDKAGQLINVNGSNYAGGVDYINSLTYRAFGGIKGINYTNGRSLSASYDNRLRPTTWNVSGVQGYSYNYNYFNEHTDRVTYAQNLNDGTLDRSFEYDHVGRLTVTHSGAEARAHAFSGQWGTMDGPFSHLYEYDPWGNMTRRLGWGGEVQGGTAGQTSDQLFTYNSNNRRVGFTYDAAGNLTNGLGQTFTYDATGQQVSASSGGLQQSYDCDRLRVKKVENGVSTYYLRSTVLGGQIVAEIKWFSVAWGWDRGYVYAGPELLAVQQLSAVNWVHEDPITKSKRITNSSGTVISSIELDPWGADTNRSNNAAFQPKKFTSYLRDGNGSDDAMFRRYNRWHSRFDQPDPYDGSYDLTDPQSFNRYAYVNNDPVNRVDPTGLMWAICHWTYSDNVSGECFGGDRWPGFDPKPGGGGRGEPEPKPEENADDEKDRKCADLANKIQELRDELAKRADELVRNEQNLPATGPNSVGGHQQQFQNKQAELRKKINEFNTNGCGGGLPWDAWQYATAPTPSPGRRNLPVHRVITPAPRPVPITPVPIPVPVRPSVPVFVPLPVIIIKCVVFGDCGQGDGRT